MRRLGAAVLLSVVVLAVMLAAPAAMAQRRFAFIVGNDTYQNVDPLQKAVNDARAVARSLQKLGFAVTLGENLQRRDFIAKFSAFENAVSPGDFVFLFYSGHGVEVDGANYLIPTDLPKVSANQLGILKDEAISTDNMIQRLKARGARAQVLVLDACRENPFRDNTGRAIGGKRGLAPTQAPGGVFVIYSAGVGETALDRLSDGDAEPNSVFTRSFLPLLEDPAKSLVVVAKETRAKVKTLAGSIGHTQSPAYYDEVDGDLFMGRLDGATPAPQAMPAPQAPPIPVPTASAGNGMIFPDSDNRYLSRAELQTLPPSLLRIARNEIFARRGRYFRDQSLAAHFSRMPWYRPFNWDDTSGALNAYEQANVTLIQSMER